MLRCSLVAKIVIILLKSPSIFSLGWYLYVSSKRVAENRRKATLASEYLSGFKCFSFAYSMNGRTMGQLTFYVIESNGKLIGYSFNKKGHQGKDWNRFEMSLDHPDFKKYSYRVISLLHYVSYQFLCQLY